MKNEIPKVFAAKIDKKINNNENYSVTKNENQVVEKQVTYEKTIDQKIREIFNSKSYVYKANVKIVLKDKTIVKKIIGKNRRQIITIDNELINIDDILDIQLEK